jgi:hypothetical protein
VEETAELAVPWHTTLSITENIYGCDVPCLLVWGGDLAKEVWVIIVGNCSRIVNTKGEKRISECGFAVDCILSLLESEIGDGCRFGVRAGCCVEESDVVLYTLASKPGLYGLGSLTWD